MKILVAIANYGYKNQEFVEKLIVSYQSMPAELDIVILSDVPKRFSKNVEVVVGLPTKNPWSLPYAHKAVFADRKRCYDLFIYSEDDILITWRNIDAFLKADAILNENQCAGFLRFEVDENNKISFPDFLGPYHWIVGSIRRIKNETFAQFSNLHSACYILTQKQLYSAIESGGYLSKPATGKYDLLCSAATDPYSRCGLTKLIWISKISDFFVHHLSNRYVKEYGISEDELFKQIDTIMDLKDKIQQRELIEPQKELNTYIYDKMYFNETDNDLLNIISPKERNILSIGCCSGTNEAILVNKNKKVTAIPVDAIVGALAKRKNINVLVPDLSEAFELIRDQVFECIVIDDLLHHFKDPIYILKKAVGFLKNGGRIIISIPNFRSIRNIKRTFPYPIFKRFDYDKNKITALSVSQVEANLRKVGFVIIEKLYPVQEFKKFRVPALFGLNEKLLSEKVYIIGTIACAGSVAN